MHILSQKLLLCPNVCYHGSMKEQIQKKDILNLIKFHAEKNEAGFKNEAYNIARFFDSIGDTELAQYRV